MTRTERIAKLKKAKEMLAAWELAELKVTSGEEYEIEGRKLKMVNMSHIVNAQAKWRQEIKRLESGRTGGARIAQIVPLG